MSCSVIICIFYPSFSGEITIPTPETNDFIKEQLKTKIRTKEFSIGELIVPKKFKKLLLDKDNNIKEVEFITEGRKRPLDEIREKMLEKQIQYTRSHPDLYYDEMTRIEVASRLKELNELDETEGLTKMRKKLKSLERTRHLIVWHDHSTVANHGHLMFMISVLYDPAFHITTEEYKEKTGKNIDIQEAVEQPQVYIIARYSNKLQQTAHAAISVNQNK